MTIGIYILYWEQDDSKVYVGQSINIELRQKYHISALTNGAHYNYKLTAAYKKYGKPCLKVIEKCTESKLDELEVHWMEEFDSINNGYNITTGCISGRGLNHSQSKYPKARLLRIFSLLYRTTLTYVRVSELSKVSVYTVHNIASGNHHLWLKSDYPVKFQQMLDNKKTRNNTNLKTLASMGINPPPLISPEGEIYNNITNIAEFCKNHPVLSTWGSNTRSSIAKVLKGTKTSHKGWHL